MKQKQVTFVLMLMSIFLSCVFNVKAQIPSFEEYDWDVFEEYEQKQDVYFIIDEYYPGNDNLSDYARTKKAIADAFKDWQQRGEFETSADYEERLKNESLIKFYNLCLAYTRYTLRQYEWTFVPIQYDIDKQEYTLELYKRKDERVDFYGDFFTAKVTIAPSDARHLKQVFETAYENSVTPFAFSLFTYYPLQCVANGKFIPTYLIFSTEAFYFEIDNSKYPGAKEITYSAAELGINNKYLAGKKCQMNEVWKILINKKMEKQAAEQRAKEEAERQAKREQRAKDSMSIVKYNEQIRAKFNKYRTELAQNRRNIGNLGVSCKYINISILNLDNTSEHIEKMNEQYNTELDSIYKSACTQITNDYLKAWNQYIEFFENGKIFEQYYCSGLDALRKEVEERKLLLNLKSFVNANTKQIQSINCQNEKLSQYNINGKSYVKVTDYIRECKSAKYYDDMVASLVACNKKLHDEYEKNGFLFDSQIEFYEAYTSGNYKAILKAKK